MTHGLLTLCVGKGRRAWILFGSNSHAKRFSFRFFFCRSESDFILLNTFLSNEENFQVDRFLFDLTRNGKMFVCDNLG